MSEQRLWFREASEIVRNRLNVSPDKAQVLLLEANAAGKVHVTIDPKYEQQLADATTTHDHLFPRKRAEPDAGLAALAESARQGALVHALFINRGMVSQDELLNWLDSFGEPKLLDAPEARIYEIVWAVYHDPANGGPSYRNLPKYVLPRLKDLGFTASLRRIQDIGKKDEFEPFRRKAGRTRTSQAG